MRANDAATEGFRTGLILFVKPECRQQGHPPRRTATSMPLRTNTTVPAHFPNRTERSRSIGGQRVMCVGEANLDLLLSGPALLGAIRAPDKTRTIPLGRDEVAAYCLMVEERYQTPVRRSQLLYQNRSLEIVFDDHLRLKLLDIVRELRAAEAVIDIPRSHNSLARCRGCGFRQVCRDSLA
jgi:hypothetical protein